MKCCPNCRSVYADAAQFCGRDGTRLVMATPSVAWRRDAWPEAGTDPPPDGPFAGRVLDDRYRLERTIGEGGMSVVYFATDLSTRRPCAIKLLSAALSRDAKAMERLKREAGFGMRLTHPNICPMIGFGETDDGAVYVVMDFIDGEVLAERTARTGHVGLDDTVRLVHDVAAGLQAVHDLGIVHRDLKPENIMVCSRADGAEYAVVMDFGLAKERRVGAELRKLTATGIVVGTPEFMSPEQLRGRPLDPRTDIYSLALVAYEMLTGRLPFDGRTQQETMIARLQKDPVPLRAARPDLDLPESVERVLDRGMSRDPSRRHGTAPEFAEALEMATRESMEGGSVARRSLGQ